MTNFGELPASPPAPVGTVGTTVAGEILAGRYRLEEHINDDARGRQVWRGIDVVLRRPVAVVVRQPGGEYASEMLNAAVAASRISHPHLVDVYDVFDEGSRAYVVREWVDGSSLRELVSDGPLDTGRATAIAHAVADAVAAAHASGTLHGNIHPGTVLIADDGRVVIADARADHTVSADGDVRAVGAILYCALTGHWPHAEAGPDRLPDGARDVSGRLASPRQMRGGLPSYLSELATDLLNPALPVPTAESLAVELGRLDTDGNDGLFGEGGLGFAPPGRDTRTGSPSRGGRKILIGVIALAVIAGLAFIVAAKLGGGNGQAQPRPTVTTTSTGQRQPPVGQPTTLTLTAGQLRIVDPPPGDRTEGAGVDKMVDGDESTGWKTSKYTHPAFGNLGKPGMGVLIDLGRPMDVTNLRVDFADAGATVGVEVGDTDPGNTSAGDDKIVKTYKAVGDQRVAGPTEVFAIGRTTRFVLLWITSLPSAGSDFPGKYQVTIDQIWIQAS